MPSSSLQHIYHNPPNDGKRVFNFILVVLNVNDSHVYWLLIDLWLVGCLWQLCLMPNELLNLDPRFQSESKHLSHWCQLPCLSIHKGRFTLWNMKSDQWQSRTMKDGLCQWTEFMIRLYKKLVLRALGPSLGVKPDVDQEERPWTKKMKVLIFLIYAQKIQFSKIKSTLTILLASIVLSWPHLSYFLVFTLNFNKHDCNGEEEEEPCFACRIIHVFVHAYEACCGHLSIAFARRMGEGCNFELGLWEYGCIEK